MVQHITSEDSCDFNTINICFNTVHPKPGHLINLIVLIVKQYIHRMRCLGSRLSYQDCITIVNNIHRYELYYAKQKNKLKKHYKKWSPRFPEYKELIDNCQNNAIQEYLSNIEITQVI